MSRPATLADWLHIIIRADEAGLPLGTYLARKSRIDHERWRHLQFVVALCKHFARYRKRRRPRQSKRPAPLWRYK